MIRFLLVLAFAFNISYAKNKDVKIMLDWFVNPDHAAIIVAKQQGLFKEQGINLTILEPADPADPPKFVSLGKVDYAVDYQPTLQMRAYKEDWKLSRVATLVSTPLNSLIVLEKSGIKKISQLKGKKIGYSLSGFEESIVATVLKKHGLKKDDVEMINVNWNLSSSLLTGRVDAVIGAYRNFELTELELHNSKGKAFYIENEGVPVYDELVLITSNKNRNNEITKKMIIAIENATHYIINNPKKSYEIFKSYKPSVLGSKLNQRAWFDTIPRISLAPAALDHKRYKKFDKYLKETGLVKSKKNIKVSAYAIDPFAQ